MSQVYKIANPEGLSEAQIKAAEEYMNRACNSPAKVVISTVSFACSDFAVTKITEALIKIATETVKINPVARIVISLGEIVIGFVAGEIISREIDRFYDETVESIATAKARIENLVQKAKESGEDIVVSAE